jgi:hypothetical protein
VAPECQPPAAAKADDTKTLRAISEAHATWRRVTGRKACKTTDDVREVLKRCLAYENFSKDPAARAEARQSQLDAFYNDVEPNLGKSDATGRKWVGVLHIASAVKASGRQGELVTKATKVFRAWHHGKSRLQVYHETQKWGHAFVPLAWLLILTTFATLGLAAYQTGWGAPSTRQRASNSHSLSPDPARPAR